MDFDTYRKSYFADPPPDQRFKYRGLYGLTLYFQDYEAAVDYYQRVLGPPAYLEGEGTRGWQLGKTWLTLLKGNEGSPRNVEVMISMGAPEQADRLQEAFIEQGGSGPSPVDTLMYEPVHVCPVQDPFGTNIMIFSPAEE